MSDAVTAGDAAVLPCSVAQEPRSGVSGTRRQGGAENGAERPNRRHLQGAVKSLGNSIRQMPDDSPYVSAYVTRRQAMALLAAAEQYLGTAS